MAGTGNVWCSLAVYHCPLELYVNRNWQIGVHAQARGGHMPQCPIAGNASGQIGQSWWYLKLLKSYRVEKHNQTYTATQTVKVSVFIQRTLCSTSLSRRSGMDHTVLPANYTNACLYLVSVHQKAPPQTKVADIQLQPTIILTPTDRHYWKQSTSLFCRCAGASEYRSTA